MGQGIRVLGLVGVLMVLLAGGCQSGARDGSAAIEADERIVLRASSPAEAASRGWSDMEPVVIQDREQIEAFLAYLVGFDGRGQRRPTVGGWHAPLEAEIVLNDGRQVVAELNPRAHLWRASGGNASLPGGDQPLREGFEAHIEQLLAR